LNPEPHEGIQYANYIGCKTTPLPIKYLGVPLHWSKLKNKDWNFLVNKVEKKLENWKSKLLSLGAD
jgi:hypothetical protein